VIYQEESSARNGQHEISKTSNPI